MSKSTINARVKRLGGARGRFAAVLPDIAREVSRAAANHEIEETDAVEIYLDYIKAATRTTNVDPYDNGIQANASKLRQIIKARDPDLIERVARAHDRISRTSTHTIISLYSAMVAACRLRARTGRRLTTEEIEKLLRRRR